MKIFHSLDFSSQKGRIEPTKSGDNLVHIEDFENINDLIRRSVRTKTPFVPEHDKNAVYDDLDKIQEEIQIEIDRFEPTDVQTEQNRSKDEQSEVKDQVQGSVESEQVQIP